MQSPMVSPIPSKLYRNICTQAKKKKKMRTTIFRGKSLLKKTRRRNQMIGIMVMMTILRALIKRG